MIRRQKKIAERYAEPNSQRILALESAGYSTQEARKIDKLERRENVLTDLRADGGLDPAEEQELERIGRELARLTADVNKEVVSHG